MYVPLGRVPSRLDLAIHSRWLQACGEPRKASVRRREPPLYQSMVVYITFSYPRWSCISALFIDIHGLYTSSDFPDRRFVATVSLPSVIYKDMHLVRIYLYIEGLGESSLAAQFGTGMQIPCACMKLARSFNALLQTCILLIACTYLLIILLILV